MSTKKVKNNLEQDGEEEKSSLNEDSQHTESTASVTCEFILDILER